MYRGILCGIRVSGTPCKLFGTQESNESLPVASTTADHTICRYVCLEADRSFDVSTLTQFRYVDSWPPSSQKAYHQKALSMTIIMDGSQVCHSIITSERSAAGVYTVSGTGFWKKGVYYQRDFVTGKLESGTQMSPNHTKDIKDLGMIKVIFRKCYYRPCSVDDLTTDTEPLGSKPTSKINEKWVQGRNLQVTAGISDRARPHVMPIFVQTQDEDRLPHATFIFLYRTRGSCLFVSLTVSEALERIGVLRPLERINPNVLDVYQLRELVQIQKRKLDEEHQELLDLRREKSQRSQVMRSPSSSTLEHSDVLELPS